MAKKLLSFALVAGAASAAFAAAKLIANRKAEKGEIAGDERNDISDAFYKARYERECGKITEEQYRETLSAIHNKAAARGESALNELLEEAYDEAGSIVYWHTWLMRDVKESESTSLEDFIRRFPDKAFEHDMLGLNPYCYEAQARDSADYIAKQYYRKLSKRESLLYEYVQMLGGNTNKIRRAFNKARESNSN